MHSSVMLLVATLRAIGTTAILAGAGIVATRQGFITSPGRRCLAEISMNLLMPALLFTSAVACTPGEPCATMGELIREAWYLFLFPLYVVGSGLLLGRLTATMTRCPKEFRKGCVGAVAFANSTGMSITLLSVLGPILVRADVIDRDPLKFQPIYLILYPMLQWAIGSHLFGLSGQKGEGPAKPPAPAAPSAPAHGDREAGDHAQQPSRADRALSSASSLRRAGSLVSSATKSVASSLAAAAPPDLGLAFEPCLAPPDLPPCGSRGSPCLASVQSLDDCLEEGSSVSEDASSACGRCGMSEVAAAEGGGPQETRSRGLRFQARLASVAARGRALAGNVLVPPVVGAVLGFLVAAVPGLRSLLVDTTNGQGSRDPPLAFLFQALYAIGRASVPINMLVLGSNLAQGANLRATPLATNLSIVVMKQLGQPVLIGLAVFGLARIVEADRAVWLVMIIMSCTPTANNIMVMVELSGQSKEAMSACIFTQYLAAPVLMTLVITVFLMLLQTPGFLP